MSYKKKKQKKNIFNQLNYLVGMVKVVLLQLWKQANSFRFRKGKMMRLLQTQRIMTFLRQQNRVVRSNNKKIDEWVDGYVNDCVLNGKSVEILTQWCISKDLEQRYLVQGSRFVPTPSEIALVAEEIPRILRVFRDNGLALNWWITLNRSYLDSGRIDRALENEYRTMIENLLTAYDLSDLIVVNWEDDILAARPGPATRVLERMSDFVTDSAFQIELKRHSAWAREEAGLVQTDRELEDDVRFQIACEAAEGNLLGGNDSPFANGQFILLPLEAVERYVFFQVLAPDFTKRIVSVLRSYPWRLDTNG